MCLPELPRSIMSQLAMFSPPVLSGLADVYEHAADEWGLNCGPGALCGALNIRPCDVRPHLGDFERRGYMSPSHMWAALKAIGIGYELKRDGHWPESEGICRVQWGGPWCAPGRPAVAAYRHTHWVAARRSSWDGGPDFVPFGTGPVWVFDVNNLIGPGAELSCGSDECPDGWLPYRWWAGGVVPELLPAKGDGRWWLTHTAEIRRPV